MTKTTLFQTMLRNSPPMVTARLLRSRAVKTFLIVFLAVMVTGTGISQAADDTEPGTGITTIIPMPDYSHGGGKNLVEGVSADQYRIDNEIDDNPVNAGDKIANGIINTVFLTTVEIGWVLVVITSWLLGSSDASQDAFNLSDLIGKTAGETLSWLFPTALALAVVFAYVNRKKNGSAFQDFAVIGILSIIAVSFVLYPATYVSGMENVRAGGQKFVESLMPETNDGYGKPFAWGNPDYSQNTPNEAFARQASDTVWRASVATQWCMVEFGSTRPCEKYGPKMLKETDPDKRTDIIKNEIYKDESLGGKEGKIGTWVHGEDWGQRLGMAVVSLAIVGLMLFLVAVLVVSAVVASFQAILLMVMGGIFLCLGLIPGAPRRWCANWAMALAGSLLSSMAALLLLTAALGAVLGVFSNTSLDWSKQYILAILILIAAVGLRRMIHSLVLNGADTSGGSGTMMRVIQAMTIRRAFRSFGRSGSGRPSTSGREGTSGQQGTAGRPGRDGVSANAARSRGNDVVGQRINSRAQHRANPSARVNARTDAGTRAPSETAKALRAEKESTSAAQRTAARATEPRESSSVAVSPAATEQAPRTGSAARAAQAARPTPARVKSNGSTVAPRTEGAPSRSTPQPATVQPATPEKRQSPVMRSNNGMTRPKPPATRPEQTSGQVARSAGQQQKARQVQAKEKAQNQKMNQRTGLRSGPPTRRAEPAQVRSAPRRARSRGENR